MSVQEQKQEQEQEQEKQQQQQQQRQQKCQTNSNKKEKVTIHKKQRLLLYMQRKRTTTYAIVLVVIGVIAVVVGVVIILKLKQIRKWTTFPTLQESNISFSTLSSSSSSEDKYQCINDDNSNNETISKKNYVAKEILDLEHKKVYVANGKFSINNEQWNKLKVKLPLIKNIHRRTLFNKHCFYKSPSSTCASTSSSTSSQTQPEATTTTISSTTVTHQKEEEKEEKKNNNNNNVNNAAVSNNNNNSSSSSSSCVVEKTLYGYTWMELAILEAIQCIPTSTKTSSSCLNPSKGNLSIMTIRKCHQIIFYDKVYELSDNQGNYYIMHATAGADVEPTLDVTLPDGWTLEERSLNQTSLTIHPFGDDTNNECYHNIVRDHLGQGYHQYQFATDIYPPSSTTSLTNGTTTNISTTNSVNKDKKQQEL